MNSKTLMMLAGITLVVMAGAAFFGQERQDKPVHGNKLVFPDLMNRINEIHEMTIETKGVTVTLIQTNNTWNVKEKGSYAADLAKIKPVLIGMAELRFREPKTKNPELYEKLGLRDIKAEGSAATLITLKTKDSSEVASLLLGNQRPAKGAPSVSEMYIRNPEDPQTWLVTGKLPIEKVSGEWLDKDLFTIVNKRVHQVRVTHPGGEKLVVYKDSPDALDFQVRDLPKGSKVSSQFNVNNVATSLAQLQLEDVTKSDDGEFSSKNGVQAVLETFDGLRVTVETMSKDEVVLSKIEAVFDPALVYQKPKQESSEKTEAVTEESKDSSKAGSEKESEELAAIDSILKTEEEVQKEVTTLNAAFKNWLFELPKFRVENFSKKKTDLIAKE